jgi:hypothetical protein
MVTRPLPCRIIWQDFYTEEFFLWLLFPFEVVIVTISENCLLCFVTSEVICDSCQHCVYIVCVTLFVSLFALCTTLMPENHDSRCTWFACLPLVAFICVPPLCPIHMLSDMLAINIAESVHQRPRSFQIV